MELAKGANAAVPSPVVRVSLASSLPAHAVDLFALELTGDRRVRDDSDLVFYNQRRSADGCLWQVDGQRVRIELGDWPRQPADNDAGPAGPAGPAGRRASGWDGTRARGGDDAGETGDDGSDVRRGWAGASRLLHVRPVARAARRAPLDLLAMDPYDFEQLVANLFTAMGYTTQRTGRSGDGGVDVEVRSDDPLASGLIVISVKRLKRTVAAHYVRELAGTVHDRDAIKGILVTTSGFGPSSWEFAAKNRLELVDGERLRTWLAEYLDLDAV
ncbi:restriction endonuclease [Pseudofrankia sp. BMG5.36]|uniref:restriction endonuclease n=1 Tax=Pseudofrankia sp. BMG5.36 TaxID=1834512 RepID=UPI0008DA9FB6|nr:restriction endonuclease [Pseudofrankia sp. BMG5.36]OHV65779.1 hypothetical protein BCD48_36335 [Pseudofrankia sp. BMG5.36]